MNVEVLKQQAAHEACMYVKNGMRLGLGSGTTMQYVLQDLKRMAALGCNIEVVCSSIGIEQMAHAYQLKVLDLSPKRMDLNIDGVDQIDGYGQIIKGGGGALLREKMLAQWADKTIWIMDERKPVNCLDTYPLPVEIIPFSYMHTIDTLTKLHYHVTLRKQQNEIYVSDNGNYILDVVIPENKTMYQAHQELKEIAGVIETGYFHNIDALAIVANETGIIHHEYSFNSK